MFVKMMTIVEVMMVGDRDNCDSGGNSGSYDDIGS